MRVLCSVGALCLLAACGDSDPAAVQRVVTFNAGLPPGAIPYRAERIGPITEALNTHPADLVCLQEVWTPDDAAFVREQTRARYPHAYSVDTTTDVLLPPPCPVAETGELRTCVEANCEGEALVLCAQMRCEAQLTALPGDCVACLLNFITEPFDTLFSACAEMGSTGRYEDNRNGLMLLSTTPLANTEIFNFPREDSFFFQRSVLSADFELHGEQVPVFCTHLQTGVSGINYDGEHGGFAAENGIQVDGLIDLVAQKAGVGPALILGDMNTGPASSPERSPTLPEHFQRFLDAGWRAPYLEDPVTPCTSCGDTLGQESEGTIIDHVLLKSLPNEVANQRLFDAPITIQAEGESLEVLLSDHFGVEAAIKAR